MFKIEAVNLNEIYISCAVQMFCTISRFWENW